MGSGSDVLPVVSTDSFSTNSPVGEQFCPADSTLVNAVVQDNSGSASPSVSLQSNEVVRDDTGSFPSRAGAQGHMFKPTGSFHSGDSVVGTRSDLNAFLSINQPVMADVPCSLPTDWGHLIIYEFIVH